MLTVNSHCMYLFAMCVYTLTFNDRISCVCFQCSERLYVIDLHRVSWNLLVDGEDGENFGGYQVHF